MASPASGRSPSAETPDPAPGHTLVSAPGSSVWSVLQPRPLAPTCPLQPPRRLNLSTENQHRLQLRTSKPVVAFHHPPKCVISLGGLLSLDVPNVSHVTRVRSLCTTFLLPYPASPALSLDSCRPDDDAPAPASPLPTWFRASPSQQVLCPPGTSSSKSP